MGLVAIALVLGVLAVAQAQGASADVSCAVSNVRTGMGYAAVQAAVEAAAADDKLVISGICVGSTTISEGPGPRGPAVERRRHADAGDRRRGDSGTRFAEVHRGSRSDGRRVSSLETAGRARLHLEVTGNTAVDGGDLGLRERVEPRPLVRRRQRGVAERRRDLRGERQHRLHQRVRCAQQPSQR